MDSEDVLSTLGNVIDSTDNTTGGGTASALAGAMAAGLVAMVARLSMGKKEMRPSSFYQEIVAEAEVLAQQLIAGSQLDADAFGQIRAAYRSPRQSPHEKETRAVRIQEAMVYAAEVPLANAEKCARVLKLRARLSPSFNQNAASDLECARYLAEAGMWGCLANVNINLLQIQDENVSEELKSRVAALQQESA